MAAVGRRLEAAMVGRELAALVGAVWGRPMVVVGAAATVVMVLLRWISERIATRETEEVERWKYPKTGNGNRKQKFEDCLEKKVSMSQERRQMERDMGNCIRKQSRPRQLTGPGELAPATLPQKANKAKRHGRSRQ